MATTRTRATAPEVSNWAADQTIGNDDFVTVWQTPPATSSPIAFIKAVFQLNTDKMYMKVYVQEEDDTISTKLDVDLETISGEFKLHKETGITFPIMQYQSPGLWCYQPADSLLIGSGDRVVIQFKSKSGAKKVALGMSEWGAV